LRRLALRLGAAALFAASALAGFRAASRWIPDAVRVAAQGTLTSALGSEVELGAVRLLFGPAIAIEAKDLSAFPSAWGPALRVERTYATIRWLDLAFGRIELQRVELEGATLRVQRRADGGFEPRALVAWVASSPWASHPASASSGGRRDTLEPVRQAVHRLRALVLPELDLELRNASVFLADPQSPGRGTRLEGLNARLLVGGFRRDLELHAETRLADAKGPRGSLAAEARRDRAGSLHAVVTATDLDLATVGSQLDALTSVVSGRLTAALDVTLAPSAHAELELDGSVSELVVAPASKDGDGASAPRLRFGQADLRATIRAEPRRIFLTAGRVGLPGREFRARGALARPVTPEAPLELTVRAEPLTLADARGLIELLPSPIREGFRRAIQPVEAGAIDALEATATAPLSRWQELVRGEPAALLSDTTLTGYVRDLGIRLDSGDRLEAVSGVLIWRADELDLRGVQAKLHGAALPQLDLAIAGLSNLRLAANAPAKPPPTVGPLAGRIPLFALLTPEPGEENLPPRWKELVIEADLVDHPALAWPLEGVRAVVTPTQEGVHFRGERGRWGGVPVTFEGNWLNKPERLVLHLTAQPVEARSAPAAPGDNWAHGRFVYEAAPVAAGHPRPSLIGSVSGSFQMEGENVRVFHGQMHLRPGGVLQGESTFDFSRSDGIPVRAQLSFEQVTVPDLAVMLGQNGENATGNVTAHGDLESVLAPHVPLFANARGYATVRATDGELTQRMPLFVSIASVSETLNPFAARDRIRYRQVDAELKFQDGQVSTEALTIDSPDLRLVASGAVGLLPPHRIEAVVALLFFGKVSRLVGMLPVINAILLGKDNGRMGAYFEVSGPFTEPRVKLVPSRSLTGSGPAQLLLEGVPSFVRSGIDAIEAVLGRRAAPAEPTGQSAKPALPAPDGM